MTASPYRTPTRFCQDSFRKHRGDSAQAEDIVSGVRSTYGGGAPDTEGGVFGELVGGEGYSGGQEKDWMVNPKDDMSAFGMKFEGWRKVAPKVGRWFRRA